MKKVTKAIKIVSGLSDEEKQEFAEYFKKDDDDVTEDSKEEVKEEVKEKVEEKEEVDKKDKVEEPSQLEVLLKQMQSLTEEVKTLKEGQKKTKAFGTQPKQGEGKDSSDFEDLFQKLAGRQY